ncbi:hypothetical protein BGZ95_000663 [Linnemannia exigua]|uniref:Uncharacterized protein n=1 Tax=Linnemannia exigua TaxID=604196 RepID=A0AAD4D7Y4_9FUNG|nr:hypothetical protein BGZ95_000663 [Linnemannia exigua]
MRHHRDNTPTLPVTMILCHREPTIPDPSAALYGLDADVRLQGLLWKLGQAFGTIWRDSALKCELRHMVFGDYTTIETPAQVSQTDVHVWIGNRGPGALIMNLITDIGLTTKHEH